MTIHALFMLLDDSDLAISPPLAEGYGLPALARELWTLWMWRLLGAPRIAQAPQSVHPVTVIVVPGFLMSDFSTRHMRAFLASLGHRVVPARIGMNLGPSPAAMAALEERVSSRQGEEIVLLGHSLGGAMCLEIARRSGGRISRVITMCTPRRTPVRTPLAPMIRLLRSRFGFAGRSVEVPDATAILALFASRDGIVDPAACQGPPSQTCEYRRIDGTHMTMGSNPDAQEAVAAFLART